MTDSRQLKYLVLLILPFGILFVAFFIFPMVKLFVASAFGPDGAQAYLAVVTEPRYLESIINTFVLSTLVTFATLVISGVAGLFLVRNRFPGRDFIVALITFPLVFPGVVVGFMVIMLAGRQGLVGDVFEMLFDYNLTLAYSMAGLFIGYVYFSIPRVILTVMAAAEKLDVHLEEAARSLGARPWRVLKDVIIPGLVPAFLASGAICFATAMGAFGTAFTLATDIDVLPMTIYTEFTLQANITTAAALSIVLGFITWVVLAITRSTAGSTVAAAG